ncbi:hypothetical protein NQ318_023258 [Aromia moschata]|uniref:EGF-like domain-containing protein n=1 Tax=Aromia moschata TaxID=1265417 RepID=A0AAV8Y4J2_9CUCU|nr:hypothetical protein NQ318_023258 [Aromia moschata]
MKRLYQKGLLTSTNKLVYETYYKDVITTRNSNEVMYSCCPGWTQVTNRSNGCNRQMAKARERYSCYKKSDKATCSKPCLNGGKCVKPELCACLKGFSGPQCEVVTTDDPICSKPCLNGGKCVLGDLCSCMKGFGGSQCEIDLNKPSVWLVCQPEEVHSSIKGVYPEPFPTTAVISGSLSGS